MDISQKILSDVISYMKYAKYIPELQRREAWDEICFRNLEMHGKKFKDVKGISTKLQEAYDQYVLPKKVLPSMRSMQFSGKPININPSRIYNCAYAPIDNWVVFSEIMFLLLGGTGVGYSVQRHHVDKLPEIQKPTKTKRYLIGDSIEGWADAVRLLCKSYFLGKPKPIFDFSDIRKKGARLITSGGKAPGPEPLKDCLHNIEKIFERKQVGEKLSTLEVHDLVCYLADAVLAGGIRRAALISLFSFGDEDMLTCKFGNWSELNPQRGRANNSVILLRHLIKEEDFKEVWKRVEASQSGEPGIYFSNDSELGSNPCQPAWAKVLSKRGIITFNELSIGDEIWSKEGWTKVIKKWSTGVNDVYKYETTASKFYGTKKHKLVSNGDKIEAENCKSIDVLSGNYINEIEILPQFVIDGLVLESGFVHDSNNSLKTLYVGKDDSDYFTSEISKFIGEYRPDISSKAYEVTTTIDHVEIGSEFDVEIPKRFVFNSSVNERVSFLRGLFSANGRIVGKEVRYKTPYKKMLDGIQLLLSSVGITSYYTIAQSTRNRFSNREALTKESYDLHISTDNVKFYESIGFIQKNKMNKLLRVINAPLVQPNKASYDIINTELISTEETFDITVDNESHTYWTEGCDVSNCVEVSLKAFQMCNLTEVNVSDVETQEEFNNRVRVASFLGTLQASYTDFHYLRDIWKKTCEKDALIGVGLTGIGSGKILKLNLKEAAKIANKENEIVSEMIGINKASRCTVVKPSGTSSIVLGTASGIHAWYDYYYLRNVRVGKNEAIYSYMVEHCPSLVADDVLKPTIQAVMSFPQKAPEGSLIRTESPLDTLERVKRFNKEWIKTGHRKGANTNNVSCTVYVKSGEWETVGNWMWENRSNYNGISVLPYDGGTYKQAPFEEITKEKYDEMMILVKDINLSDIKELDDYTDLKSELACAGGGCEVN